MILEMNGYIRENRKQAISPPCMQCFRTKLLCTSANKPSLTKKSIFDWTGNCHTIATTDLVYGTKRQAINTIRIQEECLREK